MPTVTVDNVRAARDRISGSVRTTPLLKLPVSGTAELWAKAENLQHTGSFKFRGAYNFLAALDPELRARGVVAQSSGNHAQGVAAAAHMFGCPAVIVIPEGAPEIKVERTRSWGARIVRCENSSTAREAAAEREAREHGLTIVPPFDHPWIVAGQGTAALELLEQLPEVRNILVPIGGGGLSAGVALTVKALRPDVQVLGVEPELAADAEESLRRRERVSWDAELVNRTVADGVRTQRIGQLNFELLQAHLDGVVTVAEAGIRATVGWYAREAKLVVEPTGGLTLAAWRKLQAGQADLALQPGPTALIISGGNLDPAQLAAFVSSAASTD